MLRGLQSRVTNLGLTDRVHFLGLVSGSDRVWLLRNALCLSQPSRDEGFSLSILEAMASRCPVVISDRCKFPEVGQSGGGIVVPLSVPDLAAAIGCYAIDPARRAADGSAARRLIEKSYTWAIVAAEARSMYEKSTRLGLLSPGY
jgi:glycosyltransferase involved in cell wall biosynthesis